MSFGAFGAWRSRGGASQRPYGIAGMFAGLGQGLMEMGKTQAASEQEDKKLQFQSAQEAANHAFEMNLARFRDQAEGARQEAQEKHTDARAAATLAENAKDREATREQNAQNHRDTMAIEQGRLGMEGARLNFEKTKADADAKRADITQQRADTAAARAEATAKKNEANEQLRNLNDANKTDQATIKSLETEAKGASDDDAAAIKKQISDLRASIAARQAEADGLRTAHGGGPKAATGGFVDEMGKPDTSGTPAPRGSDLFGAASSSGGLGSDLDPQRQAIMQALIQQRKMDPQAAYSQAKALPQDAVNKATGSQPRADAAPPTGSDDFMPPSDAAPTPQAVASSAAPASGMPQPADQGAPQIAPQEGPQDAAPDQQQAPDPAAQYADVAQQMQQTPDGQGTLTTLDRLAVAQPGPVADKLRRAAQNTISEQYPDVDADGFIDNYLQQQQQQPEQPEYA